MKRIMEPALAGKNECRGTRTPGRRIALLFLLGVLGTSVTSCAVSHPVPVPVVTALKVRNTSFFDVNVYASTSPGGPSTRLGTVPGSSTATFPIRSVDLQSDGHLVVQLHPIGTRVKWTSESLAVGPELIAVLDVSTDMSGDCSRSSLYAIMSTLTSPR